MPSPPTAPSTGVTGTPPGTASPMPPTETSVPPTATSPPAATSIPSAVTLSATPTLTPATAASSPTATTVLPAATSSPTATAVPATETLTPTPTSTPVTADPKPTTTATPTPTAEAPLAQVSGRVVRDGASVGAGIVVELREIDVDGTTTTTATATTDADGRYAFDSASLEETFDVVFAHGWNAQRYTADQVASWAWLEGAAPLDDAGIQLPDLEISLEADSERFELVEPAAGASFSAGQISPRTPLTFEWTPYSGAGFYWVDLGREGETVPVWQSLLPFRTSISFNGTLNDKTRITVGTYWWSVGAQKQIGEFELFVYGWSRALIIEE
jgi:hypothetical protein